MAVAPTVVYLAGSFGVFGAVLYTHWPMSLGSPPPMTDAGLYTTGHDAKNYLHRAERMNMRIQKVL